MAPSATVTSKGHITLPKALRDRHHLHAERVLILDSSEGIVLKHGKSSLRGALKGRLDSAAFEKELRRLRGEWKA
jgi:AbrB family looped-hinge helix DNA binding protein